MVTIQDIADHLNIAKSTVSKSLNDGPDISEELKKQVLETAVELGYTKLRRYKKRSDRLAILVQNEHISFKKPDDFAYDIIMGFRCAAEPLGFEVEIVPVDTNTQTENEYDVFLLRNQFSGAFLLGFSLLDPWLKQCESTKYPTVLYDNYITGNPVTLSLGIDNIEGMELAIRHLKQLGHKKIGYLSSSLKSHIMQVRYNAFINALSSLGVKFDERLIGCEYDINKCVNELLPDILSQGVTALVCSQDTYAIAAIEKCKELGMNIPADLNIIGFDDIPLASQVSPQLTTIRQDRMQLGKSGFAALNSLINNISIGTVLLHAQLIIRDSTAPTAK